uniref:PH domain-containing protein n=2 Tax=Kalmanozyma brasiliensis (strain GHG001) TaxID=1365824 RepID=V5F100_KALBG
MQSCPSDAANDEPVQIRHKQLVITGEALGLSRPHDLDLVSSDPYSRRPTNAVCIVSSANVTDLCEWQRALEGAIDRGRSAYRDRFERRRSSASMLDTIALFEQLQDRTREEWCLDTTTPMLGASSSLPSLEPSSTREATESDFSASAFIDYYASPTTTTTTASTPYSFKDAYLSIMRRYADSELTSPLASGPRSGRLDVPVSPCSFDFEDDEDESPCSPLDPWLPQRAAKGSISSASSNSYADETVRQIFAEGFRC